MDESRGSAGAAKERIPEIQRLIAEAEQKTRENRRSLAGAKDAASKALNDAETAQQIAEKASQVRGEN